MTHIEVKNDRKSETDHHEEHAQKIKGRVQSFEGG
jgi:translation elongation factor EF-1beta